MLKDNRVKPKPARETAQLYCSIDFSGANLVYISGNFAH